MEKTRRRLMIEDMQLRGFSPHTQAAYLMRVTLFARFCNKHPDHLGEKEIREYLLHLVNEKHASYAVLTQTYFALRPCEVPSAGEGKGMKKQISVVIHQSYVPRSRLHCHARAGMKPLNDGAIAHNRVWYTNHREVRPMAKENIVTIDRVAVRKKDIEKIKRIFRVKDNAEAVQKALDVTTGKIELEAIFGKHKGVKIQKVYA